MIKNDDNHAMAILLGMPTYINDVDKPAMVIFHIWADNIYKYDDKPAMVISISGLTTVLSSMMTSLQRLDSKSWMTTCY